MINLGVIHLDPWAFAAFLVILLLVLTPLIGEFLGALLDQLLGALGSLLNKVAFWLGDGQRAMWGHVKRHFTRHAQPEEATLAQTQMQASMPATQATQMAPALSAAQAGQSMQSGQAGAATGWHDDMPLAMNPAMDPAMDPAALDSFAGDEDGVDSSTGQDGAPSRQAPARNTHLDYWVEAFFSELLYLALVLAVAISDLVFSAERINAVIFKSDTPVNFGPFNFLRDMGSGLAGILFVGIAMLAGMLALDFYNVLPRAAQLFPNANEQQRKVLLRISLGMLGLGAISVLILFMLGQADVDNLNLTFPAAEYILVAVLGIAMIGVVALAFWGMIRGLSALIVIVLAAVGAVCALLAFVFKFAADIIVAAGHFLNDSLVRLYEALRGKPYSPSRAHPGSRLVITGVGRNSSEFAAQVSGEMTRLAGVDSVLGVGIYTQDPDVYSRAMRRLKGAGVPGHGPHAAKALSVRPNQRLALARLAHNVRRAYLEADPDSTQGASPRLLVWIVDADETAVEGNLLQWTVNLVRNWQNQQASPIPGLTVAVICLLPHQLPPALSQSRVFDQLAALTMAPASEHANSPSSLTIAPTILMVDDIHGGNRHIDRETSRDLFARSLAASFVATKQSNNHSFSEVLHALRARDYAFAAMGADSAGVVATQPEPGFRGWLQRVRGFRGLPFLNDVTGRSEDRASDLLEGSGAYSVPVTPDATGREPVAAVCLAPIAALHQDAQTYRASITRWFADPTHYVPLVSLLVDDHVEGIDISQANPAAFGDRYCQVAIVYGLQDVESGLQETPQNRPTLEEALPEVAARQTPSRQTYL